MRDFCFIEWLGGQSRLYVRDFCGAIQIMAHSVLDGGAFPSRARDGRLFAPEIWLSPCTFIGKT
jgi:hypothetical protein